jgi:hypothetical protein
MKEFYMRGEVKRKFVGRMTGISDQGSVIRRRVGGKTHRLRSFTPRRGVQDDSVVGRRFARGLKPIER